MLHCSLLLLHMELFKELTASEEHNFRQWAKDNYQPFTPISGVWHPVIQDECRRINEAVGKVFEGHWYP